MWGIDHAALRDKARFRERGPQSEDEAALPQTEFLETVCVLRARIACALPPAPVPVLPLEASPRTDKFHPFGPIPMIYPEEIIQQKHPST